MTRRRAVITGAGVVTAAGAGLEVQRHALARGEAAAAPLESFDARGFPNGRVLQVRGLDSRALARTRKDAKILSRASLLALAALDDLTRQRPPGAGLPFAESPWRSGLFLGVGLEQSDHRDLLAPALASRGNGNRISLERLAEEGMAAMNPLASLKTLPNMALAHLAIKMGEAAPRGPNAAYSPWDASSIEAVAAASAAVVDGECEAALAGGADSPLSLFGLTTLARLEVTSAVRPAGEGAALFIVEEASRALASGRTILAEVEGAGSASDGAATGSPSEVHAAAAIRGAFEAAAVSPAELDAAVFSGFGGERQIDDRAFSRVSDQMRAAPKRTLRTIFPRAVFGECGAASGALGVAAGLLALGAGADRALVTATAFGGSYAALLLRRWQG